jgi:hypothetical protein
LRGCLAQELEEGANSLPAWGEGHSVDADQVLTIVFVLDYSRPMGIWPTVFHLTQYKAGSQWIYHILKRCAPDRVVTPRIFAAHATKDPILARHIYPTVYLTKEEFEQIKKPTDTTFFIVLRDLRDITVSLYFSLKISHLLIGDIAEMRLELCNRDLESGFIWVIENVTHYSADIGLSWAKSGEQWIRYEDLLTRDIELLEETLLYRCRLPVKDQVLREAILSCRFEQESGGRQRGEEDIHSHVRKGVPGDWRQYFSAPIKAAFKERFGEVLIACGYEKSNDW